MDKRMIENARVRRATANALIALMKRKRFSEISVTDIVREAGIARQSYYRNFDCKEDVIREYMIEIQQNTMKQIKKEHLCEMNPAAIKTILDGLKNHSSEMNVIYNAGLSVLVLDAINEVCEMCFGNMPFNSTQRYQLYCLAGMIFNVEMKWLQNGVAEDSAELADVIFSFSTKELIDVGENTFTYRPL